MTVLLRCWGIGGGRTSATTATLFRHQRISSVICSQQRTTTQQKIIGGASSTTRSSFQQQQHLLSLPQHRDFSVLSSSQPRRGFFTTTTTSNDDNDDDNTNGGDNDDTTTPSSTTDDNDSNSNEYLTGIVKFYYRQKAYGFVTVEDGNENSESLRRDVWLHRRSIFCHRSIEETGPYKPFLLKGERVKFKVIPVDNGPTHEMAIDVKFENSTLVPIYRKGYLASVRKSEISKFGQYVFGIMNNPLLNDSAKIREIRQAMDHTQRTLQKAEHNLKNEPSESRP